MKSRLCFQFQEMRPWMRDVVLASKSEFALLITPPEADPFDGRVRVVGRCWIGGDNVEMQYVQQGVSGADLYFGRCLSFYTARPYVYAWQAANEPYNGSPAARRNLTAFTVRLAALMHTRGLRLAAGAFSAGTPDVTDPAAIAELRPVFSVGDLLLLHQYGAPMMQTEAEWYTLRHRKLHAMLAGNHSPIFIGETGIDGGVINRPKTGWKTFAPDWADYFAQLRWYDGELAHDDYVVAATPFTAGANNEWGDFDLTEQHCREIAAYTASKWEEEPMSNPIPPIQIPSVIMPIVNTAKAWYTADELFGPYDAHPTRARDWNLETGGNSDLGEPLQAPCDGTVVYAGNAGGGHGIVVSFVAVIDGKLANWHWKHLLKADVKQWQRMKQGEIIGAIGNAGGQYSAHLHEEIVVGAITGPTQDWRDTTYKYVDPAQWYIANGVPKAQVERMFKRDSR